MNSPSEDQELVAFMDQYIGLVNKRIYDLLRGGPETLYRASSHLITAGGKRLRPLVLGLVAKGYGVDPLISSIAGASIEILHNFTLVHDDIMDRDEFRRGIPTTHRVYGEEMAILAGDLLFAKSYEAMLSLADVGVRSESILKIIRILNWASITVAEGQALDMMLSNTTDASEEQYLEMIYKKTSALFIASAMIGAILGNADREDLESIRECFRSAGIAFQIRDDLIGLKGDPSITGKPVLSDIREGKKTIMVIHALRSLPEDRRKLLLRALGNREASREDLERARELIVESGGVEYAEDLVKKHVSRSMESLERIRGADRRVIGWIKELILRLAWRER